MASTDMAPSQRARGLEEDYAKAQVPASARRPWYDLTFVAAGFNICTITIVFGGIIAQSFNLATSMLAIIIGTGILTIFSCLFAIIGQKTGFGLVLLSKKIFGIQGQKAPGFMWGLANFVWNAVFGVTTVMIVALPLPTVTEYPVIVLGIISAVYLAMWSVSSLYGMKLMIWVGRIGVPGLLLIMFVTTIVAIQRVGGWGAIWAAEPPQPGSISFLYAIAMSITIWVIGSSQIGDLTRFAKNRGGAIATSALSMGVAGLIQFFMGAVLVLSVGAADVGIAFRELYGPFAWVMPLVWVFVWLGSWSSSQTQNYSGSMAWTNVFGTSRVLTTAVFGGLSCVLSAIMIWFGMTESITAWMSALGMIYPGFLGAILADVLIVRRWKIMDNNPAINWRAIITWAVTSVISFTLYQLNVLDIAFIYYTPAIGMVIYTLLSIPQMQEYRRQSADTTAELA